MAYVSKGLNIYFIILLGQNFTYEIDFDKKKKTIEYYLNC